MCSNIPCKVWLYCLNTDEAEEFISRFKSSISAINNNGKYTELRILSENKPNENARRVDATLEDLFFYYFGIEGGNKYD